MNFQKHKRSKNVTCSDSGIPVAQSIEKIQTQSNVNQNPINENICQFLPQDLIAQLNLEDTLIKSNQLDTSLQYGNETNSYPSTDASASKPQPCVSNFQEIRDELRQGEAVNRTQFKPRSSETRKDVNLQEGLQYPPKIYSSNDIPEVSQVSSFYYPQGQNRINQCNYNSRYMGESSTSMGQNYLLMQSCYPGMGGYPAVVYSNLVPYCNQNQIRPFLPFNTQCPEMHTEDLSIPRISQTDFSHPPTLSCKIVHPRKFEELFGFPGTYQKNAISSYPLKSMLKKDSDNNDHKHEIQYLEIINMSNEDLISLIKTPSGNIALQKILETLSQEDIQFLMEKILCNAKEIMCDHNGNYFMQKLIQFCHASQRILLLKSVRDNFLEIANNASGSHSIQSLIDTCIEEEEQKLVNECIENQIMKLSCNSNGTHIIQKIITKLEENKRDFINDFIIENMKEMCMNANGICVVKKFISENRDRCITQKLISILEYNSIEMSEDQYGNYVIQHAIDVYGLELCARIFKIVVDNFVRLSNQKFSSNVVEKIIFIFAKYQRDDFNSILNEMYINTWNFTTLFKNKYGYFVLTNTIQLMTPQHRMQIKDTLISSISVNGAKERQKFSKLLTLMCC